MLSQSDLILHHKLVKRAVWTARHCIFEILSVLGVAFDTLALNTVGHTCYMVYNVGLYSVPSVKEEYHRRHPFGINPVKINDIFFPLQTLVTLSIAIYQCCSYEVSKLYTT